MATTEESSQEPKRTSIRGLTQAYEIRDFSADSIMELKEERCDSLADKLARAKAVQALASVWSDATEKIRIIRGKPLPGSLRPIAKPKKPKLQDNSPREEPSSTG
jgi:hypothetical protein